MDQTQIAKVYATALLEIAEETKAVDLFEQELKAVVEALMRDEEVWNFLTSPRIPKVDKNRIVEKVLKGNVSETILSLLSILVKNDRFLFLKTIQQQFVAGIDELNGRVRVRIYSAEKLSDKEVNEVKATLESKVKGECIIETLVSPELIGGLVIKLKDQVIDGSIKNQLDILKQKLKQIRLQSGALYEN